MRSFIVADARMLAMVVLRRSPDWLSAETISLTLRLSSEAPKLVKASLVPNRPWG